jgi:hypothetical protein
MENHPTPNATPSPKEHKSAFAINWMTFFAFILGVFFTEIITPQIKDWIDPAPTANLKCNITRNEYLRGPDLYYRFYFYIRNTGDAPAEDVIVTLKYFDSPDLGIMDHSMVPVSNTPSWGNVANKVFKRLSPLQPGKTSEFQWELIAVDFDKLSEQYKHNPDEFGITVPSVKAECKTDADEYRYKKI